MDADWIREFRAAGTCTSWRGHVFLELYDDAGARWVLLDATGMVLYPDYSPRSRILPGNRFAYDKGGDPYALVLSTRWEEWKEQTRAYFREFDLAQLPVATGRPIDAPGKVFIAADNPAWQWLADRCAALGREVGPSGNSDFEHWLPRSRGHVLVVAGVGGSVVLPTDARAQFLTPELEATFAANAGCAAWTARGTLPDGTFVVLVQGKDPDSLRGEIAALALDGKK